MSFSLFYGSDNLVTIGSDFFCGEIGIGLLQLGDQIVQS